MGPLDSDSSIEFGWSESIPDHAFQYVENLSKVTLPDSIKYIGSMSFTSCDKLQSIVIPQNVKSIGYYAFGWCSNLESVYFDGHKPVFIDSEAFGTETITVYYPYNDETWDELPNNLSSKKITWKVWEYGDIESIKCENSSRNIYVVGDVLKHDGLVVTAKYDTGYEEIVPIEQLDFECDMNSPGDKEVIVKYKGKSSSYRIYVHDEELITIDKDAYPESTHNYPNNCDETQHINCYGSERIWITFSKDTYVEPNIDYIYVLGNGYEGKYTGSQLAGKTLTIDGDSVSIRLVSDGDASFYGYSIDNIYGEKIVHISEQEATCTDNQLCEKGNVLIKDTDYSVTYSSNTNVGTGEVTITLKGNYSGTKTIKFKIVPKTITGVKATSAGYNSVKISWSKTMVLMDIRYTEQQVRVVLIVKLRPLQVAPLYHTRIQDFQKEKLIISR